MELGKFLQKDIVDFLNSKADEVRESLVEARSEELSLFSVERDYADEVEQALLSGNLGHAKHVFDELRRLYNDLGKDSLDREKLYAVLQEVYALIKEYFDDQSHSVSLSDEIHSLDINNLGSQGPKKGAKTDAKSVSAIEHDDAVKGSSLSVEESFEQEALKAHREREARDEAMSKAVAVVQQALLDEDAFKAVHAYRDLKSLFSSYPSDDKFRKIEWYNQVMAYYDRIRKLNEANKQAAKTSASPVAQDVSQAPQGVAIEDTRSLDLAKRSVKVVIAALNSHDLHGAESLLMDARRAVAGIHENFASEKKSLEDIMSKIVHKIQFLKQHGDGDDVPRPDGEVSPKQQTHQQPVSTSAQEVVSSVQPQSVAQSVPDANSLYEQGVSFQLMGRLDDARRCYEQVLSVQPHHAQSLARLKQLHSVKNPVGGANEF